MEKIRNEQDKNCQAKPEKIRKLQHLKIS